MSMARLEWSRNTQKVGLKSWKAEDVSKPEYSIEISQNTEKSPGDPRKVAFTQTSMKDNQPTLVWKTPNNNSK